MPVDIGLAEQYATTPGQERTQVVRRCGWCGDEAVDLVEAARRRTWAGRTPQAHLGYDRPGSATKLRRVSPAHYGLLMTSRTMRVTGIAITAVAVVTTAAPAGADPRVGGEIGYAYEYRYDGARSFPITAEEATSSGRGRWQDFEGGSMYWAPWSGAHMMRGDIQETYGNVMCSYRCGFGEDVLGFPITSEIRTPNGRGAYNHFQWGSIYWSPATGAQPVYGEIREAWADTGWEGGPLGFPTTEESYDYDADGMVQHYENGAIVWRGDHAEIFYQPVD